MKKYDKVKEAEHGFGRMTLYVSLKALESIEKLREVVRAPNGSIISKSQIVDLAIQQMVARYLDKDESPSRDGEVTI